MWRIKTIRLEQFISHLDNTYNFKNGICDVINGSNLDDESQESNGSGKSAIVEGIIFALTGDSFRKVKTVDIIMDYKDFAEVSMVMENDLIKSKLEIVRRIERKKSSTLSIKENGIPKKDLISVADGDKYILSQLDITRDDLMNYFVVSKDKYVSFFSSSDTKKKEIISRFSGASLISNVDKFIDAELDELDEEFQEIGKAKSNVEGQISAIKEQLESNQSKEDFEKAINEEIEEMQCDKSEHQLKIRTLESEIDSQRAKVSEAKEKLKKIDVDKLEKKVKEIDKSEQHKYVDLKKVQEELTEMEDIILEVEKNLKGSVECPECKFEFSVTNKEFNVKEAKSMLPDLKEGKEELDSNKAKIKSDISKFEVERNQLKAQIKKLKDDKDKIDSEIKRTNLSIETATKSIEMNRNQIKSIDMNIDRLKRREFVDSTSSLSEKLQKLEDQLVKIDSDLNNMQDAINTTSAWTFNFKKFRTFLANKSIKSIESFANLYLSKMRTSLNVKIEGYKLLSNGTLKENITIEVLRDGMSKGLFEKFSGGERMRIDICVILALQKLINISSKSGGLDLMVLDEIIESVDAQGVKEILNLLNNLNQTVICITHTNQVNDFINRTVVEKSGGYSHIK